MSDAKKIIIDEDWKSQVAAEKAAAERVQSTGESPAPSAAEAAADDRQFPPASFEMLVTIFATEAMGGLGQLPNPMTQKLEVDLPQARYAIDMLEMLAEKTKGNLNPGEEAGMTQLLHQLRLAFVAVQTETAKGTIGQ